MRLSRLPWWFFVVGPPWSRYLLLSFWFAVGLHPPSRALDSRKALHPGQGTRNAAFLRAPSNILSLKSGYHNEHPRSPSRPLESSSETDGRGARKSTGICAAFVSSVGLLVRIFLNGPALLAREARIVRDRRSREKWIASLGKRLMLAN